MANYATDRLEGFTTSPRRRVQVISKGDIITLGVEDAEGETAEEYRSSSFTKTAGWLTFDRDDLPEIISLLARALAQGAEK